MKVGDFKCDKEFVVASLKHALDGIKSNFNNVKLIVSDAAKYNISAKTEIISKYTNIN